MTAAQHRVHRDPARLQRSAHRPPHVDAARRPRPPTSPDAGCELPGERLQRAPEVAHLGGAERQERRVRRAQRLRRVIDAGAPPAVAEPGDLLGEGPAERLQGPGDLVTAQRQLELGAGPLVAQPAHRRRQHVGDVEGAQDAIGDGAVGRLVVPEHRHRPGRQRPHRLDVAGRRRGQHGGAKDLRRSRVVGGARRSMLAGSLWRRRHRGEDQIEGPVEHGELGFVLDQHGAQADPHDLAVRHVEHRQRSSGVDHVARRHVDARPPQRAGERHEPVDHRRRPLDEPTARSVSTASAAP
jgi:hypothetical protein